MTVIFFILIVIACIILSLVVLVQNPKGGGLAGSIGGFNNQFMGVKQTTDVLEKGTWLFAAVIGALCIFSSLFFKGGTTTTIDTKNLPVSTSPPAPGTGQPSTPLQPPKTH